MTKNVAQDSCPLETVILGVTALYSLGGEHRIINDRIENYGTKYPLHLKVALPQ